MKMGQSPTTVTLYYRGTDPIAYEHCIPFVE